MQSVSLLEQLTRNVPLSIVSGAVLALILISTIACRVFFFSPKSKQHAKNEKKSTNKKQPTETAPANKKKATKAKKNVVPVQSSSPSTQSEESEEEKTPVVAQMKKVTPSNQVSKDKKVVPAKQTSPANIDVQEKPVDNKKKQTKATNEKTKVEPTKKVNGTVSDKKQPVPASSEAKRAPVVVDEEKGSDQEDEGQWVTQGTKQVNNRNRNKGKTETTAAPVNQPSSPSASKKRSIPTASSSVASATKVEAEVEPATQPTPAPEPIEVCQLVSKAENRYTANDAWWKQALNQKQNFSINDIGDWPERDQEEQYTVLVKRIVPVQNRNDM